MKPATLPMCEVKLVAPSMHGEPTGLSWWINDPCAQPTTRLPSVNQQRLMDALDLLASRFSVRKTAAQEVEPLLEAASTRAFIQPVAAPPP